MLTNYDIMRIEDILFKAQKHSNVIKIKHKLESIPVPQLAEIYNRFFMGQYQTRIAYRGDFICKHGPKAFIIQIFLEEESNALIVSSQFDKNDCHYGEAIKLNSKFNEDDGELDEICSVITEWLNLLNFDLIKEHIMIKSVVESAF